MKTLLVVDDEFQIRENTAAFIRQQFPALTVLTASNGRDALELIVARDAEAMLLDIKMKYVDGLTLLKELAERGCMIPTVIISGYSDFHYAQQAIDAGVLRYLTKPFTPQEIESIVAELARKVDADKARAETLELLRAKVRQNVVQLRDELFSSWLFGRIEVQTLQKKGQFLNCSFDSPYYQVVLLCPACEDEAESEAARLHLRSLAEECCDPRLQIFSTYEGIALVFGLAEQQPTGYGGLVQSLLDDPLCAKVCAGVGRVQTGLSGLVRSYRQAADAVREGRMPDCSRIAVWAETDVDPCAAPFDSASFTLALQQGDLEYVQQQLDAGAQDGEINQSLTIEEAETICLQALCCCKAAFPSSSRQLEGAPSYGHYLTRLSQMGSAENMLRFTFEIVKRCLERAAEQDRMPGQLIQRIRRFIDKNYAQEITVTLIAEQMGFNANYLGKIFKKYYGESISGYISRVRVQKAVALFRSTGMNVSEIAEAVGFHDQAYFSQVFKRVTGESPSSYRKHNGG